MTEECEICQHLPKLFGVESRLAVQGQCDFKAQPSRGKANEDCD